MQKLSSGKVRDIYTVDDKSLMIVVSDRVSAFDVIMNDPIPDKGKILTQMSEFWFDFTSDIVPNHVISTDPSEFPPEFQTPEFRGRSMLVKKLKMLPIECIARGYITGQGWDSYQRTGIAWLTTPPSGMQESQRLAAPLFTPSSKATDGEHDEYISFEQMRVLIGLDLALRVRDLTLEIYSKCAEYAQTRGIIIADTKLEFGLDDNGTLVLGDEIATPDSSRFWAADRYEIGRGQDSFDKQPLRDWLESSGFKGKSPDHLPDEIITSTRTRYLEAFTRLTGRTLKA
ncbi:MAG: phosphoribosylaminoimidazolesuccinocarboxamide synthase [Oscillospiraceae bacterium]|jgi:phosphoribosylaminoimidazole-succinocarboxamide synthase|nr:phosphoribosylaminoimidazolesuccinocarboxamide synthase [Oscillospiraceae bacterium]